MVALVYGRLSVKIINALSLAPQARVYLWYLVSSQRSIQTRLKLRIFRIDLIKVKKWYLNGVASQTPSSITNWYCGIVSQLKERERARLCHDITHFASGGIFDFA